ncbi:hypothetical protein [uncultured Roseobacter sp.]|uniref:hypothetical protein n=1 Tax=uncultured Roseobacter sp. TaxID=114847 RepID=UPI0026271E87|nr:hypothetical protein [uncultured Roseobacter sp.]
MRAFLEQLLGLITDNPVLITTGSILTFVTLATGIMQRIASPVLRDVFVFILCAVSVVLLIRLYVQTARPSFEHARKKLRANPWLYALRNTWGAFLITVLVLMTVAVAVATPMQALAGHLKPPYTIAVQQTRLPSACRKCPTLIDAFGRQTVESCLAVDSGGVVTIDLDRWRHYRPQKIKATCTDGSSMKTDLD